MRANLRRILGWALLAAVLVAAGVFVAYVLRSPEGAPAPAGSGSGVVQRSGSAPKPPPVIVTPPTEHKPPPAAVPEAPQTGSATGRVVTQDGRVMRDARIEAFRGAAVGVPLFASAVSLGKRVQVDDAGRFTLADLPVMSELMLRADGESFAVTDAGPFAIVAGQRTDVGDLLVSPGLTITGNVFDPRGKPVAGARVGLFQGMALTDDDSGPPKPSRQVVSDEAGLFRIANARMGPLTLRASAPGFANAEVTGGPQPGETVYALNIPIALQEARALSGTVATAPDHAPLPGARVIATPMDPGHGGSETATDAQGRFAFGDLAPGHYQVRATAPGHSEGTAMAATDTAEAFVEIELPTQGTLAGLVVGSDGQPVTHFDLQPMFRERPTDPSAARGKSQRVTNPSGEFHVEGLDPGFWSVQIWAKGYAVTESDSVRVHQGESVTGLTAQLVRGGTLSGRVLDESGSPVANAELWLNENRQPAIDQPGVVERPPLAKSTRTDAQGHFDLTDITPRAYQVVVDHPQFSLHRRDDVLVAAGEDQELTPFVLQRAATLEGLALEPNGQLLGAVNVWLVDDHGDQRQTTTDGKGHFAFERLHPGSYHLRCYGRNVTFLAVVSAEAAATQSRDQFTIAAGEAVTRNVISSQ